MLIGHVKTKEIKKMVKLLNRLIVWLRRKRLTDSDIVDCLEFITKK